MKTLITSLVFSMVLGLSSLAQDIETLRLKPDQYMTRADVHVVKVVEEPVAVLVLCPGVNGNGKRFLSSQDWLQFCKDNRLWMVGLSFASDPKDFYNGKGYFYAAYKSGDLLEDALDQAGVDQLPILMFGFSGGGHFVSRFVEWKPERIAAWCVYAACRFDEPLPAKVTPPGIVACGENDPRLGSSLIYFKQGRAVRKPWLWVEVLNTGHQMDKDMIFFMRAYFQLFIQQSGNKTKGLWVDISNGKQVSDGEA